MRRRFAILSLCLALCLALAATAFAGPALDRINKTKELRVGMAGDYPPLNALDKKGGMIGLDAELADLLAGSLGVTLKIQTMPFERLLPALKSGQIDLIISGMTITPKRNLDALFVGPYFISGQTVLTTTEFAGKLSQSGDLNKPGVTIAAAKGTTSESTARDLFGKAKIITSKTLGGAIKLMLEGKANAVVTDYALAAVTRFRNPEKNLASLDKPFTYEPLGIAVPAGDPQLANLITNFLGVLKGSGQMAVMEKRWFQSAGWMKDLK